MIYEFTSRRSQIDRVHFLTARQICRYRHALSLNPLITCNTLFKAS